jgi:transcriptional regulator with XRE-family HTH domain
MPKPNETLRAWRKFRGLSADELAAQAGYHRSFIYKVETGRRKYDQVFLEKVAEVLGCEPADLLGRPPSSEDVVLNLTAEERQLLARLFAAIKGK